MSLPVCNTGEGRTERVRLAAAVHRGPPAANPGLPELLPFFMGHREDRRLCVIHIMSLLVRE